MQLKLSDKCKQTAGNLNHIKFIPKTKRVII